MMKRELLFAVLIVVSLLSFNDISANAQSVRIELLVYFDNPTIGGVPHPRSTKPIYAEFDGQCLTFSAFECDCTVEIEECERGVVVYTCDVPEGTTSCQIPSLPSGKYAVIFIVTETIYWGELEL